MLVLVKVNESEFRNRNYSGLQKFAENAKTNFASWELPGWTPEVALDTSCSS